jgi:hypothetical protein
MMKMMRLTCQRIGGLDHQLLGIPIQTDLMFVCFIFSAALYDYVFCIVSNTQTGNAVAGCRSVLLIAPVLCELGYIVQFM